MALVHSCPKCRRMMAKQDRRVKKHDGIIPFKGVNLTVKENEAPRLKCSCGKVIILLKASL